MTAGHPMILVIQSMARVWHARQIIKCLNLLGRYRSKNVFRSEAMTFGGPHLLADKKAGAPLSRVNLQHHADQVYKEEFLQLEIDRCPTLLPIYFGQE